MGELANLILTKEGIFALGFFALLVWVLHTNNNREMRYIDTIDKFTDRFDSIENKVEDTEKLFNTKFDSLDRKLDKLAYQQTKTLD